MIIHGQIQSVEKREMPDGGEIYTLMVFDVSKPSQLRTTGAFVTYLGSKARLDLPQGDLVDEKITIIVREIGFQNGLVKLKGKILFGIIPAEELVKTEPGTLPERPKSSAAPASK